MPSVETSLTDTDRNLEFIVQEGRGACEVGTRIKTEVVQGGEDRQREKREETGKWKKAGRGLGEGEREEAGRGGSSNSAI